MDLVCDLACVCVCTICMEILIPNEQNFSKMYTNTTWIEFKCFRMLFYARLWMCSIRSSFYAIRHNNDDCWYFGCCCVLKFIRGPMLNVKYFIFSPPVSNWIESFWSLFSCMFLCTICGVSLCVYLSLSHCLSYRSIAVNLFLCLSFFLRTHEKSTYFTI